LRALLAASIATCVFLSLVLIVGSVQVVSDYMTFGVSYIETITVNGVVSTQSITLYSQVFSMLALLWLDLVIVLLTRDIYNAGRYRGGLAEA